ncbi:hypothetical protein XH83_38985 (plasmid) [Bradyrhizobium sp. CCBAU 53351]|uniref:Uncharacterized protein n=2 Tax=Bradyrhizobium TaxID=374 RepID=A0AAE5X8H8_9BRAD|nr:hypothetical protein X265_36995 [Bradyrhizobium guangdongense]QAU50767.1 hypothetical protein XH91_36205 [Bradyrhizobium guangzhouense]QOZ49641.1 hypothetical protein XH89_40055 [Bradyrhizobium sp. CCBAU 53340]QOZ56759.1 hypothetical protein XH90_35845 [Bradyrhizobium sp. CCBAU 53338]QOZ81401.1 hypothetical protein XH83_38985 [Bradyrhizobium sp. CCBAU 53351]
MPATLELLKELPTESLTDGVTDANDMRRTAVSKNTPEHAPRRAIVHVRQSADDQVINNRVDRAGSKA